MTNKIADIFKKSLPSIPREWADAFADGMPRYYNAFRTRRDGDMNYMSAPDYHNELNLIMVVEERELWVHSPQFRKAVALALGELFKTKIAMFSPPNTVDIEHSVMFIDAHFNRWCLTLLRSETDPDKFRICMRFPLSDTKVYPFEKTSDKEMNDPAFNKKDVAFLVQDTTALWQSDDRD